MNEIIAAVGDGTFRNADAVEATSQILRAAIERNPALAQLIEPVGTLPVDVNAI